MTIQEARALLVARCAWQKEDSVVFSPDDMDALRVILSELTRLNSSVEKLKAENTRLLYRDDMGR